MQDHKPLTARLLAVKKRISIHEARKWVTLIRKCARCLRQWAVIFSLTWTHLTHAVLQDPTLLLSYLETFQAFQYRAKILHSPLRTLWTWMTSTKVVRRWDLHFSSPTTPLWKVRRMVEEPSKSDIQQKQRQSLNHCLEPNFTRLRLRSRIQRQQHSVYQQFLSWSLYHTSSRTIWKIEKFGNKLCIADGREWLNPQKMLLSKAMYVCAYKR